MRKCVRNFVEIVAQDLPIGEPIYEFGSFQVKGQRKLANLRPIFQGKTYIGCDIRHGPGVDNILNIQNTNLPSDSIGTVIIVETLEHVQDMKKAIHEAYRIMQNGALIVVTSCMKFPIHEYPKDYWRVTPQGLKLLLHHFNSVIVGWAGDDDFPHSVVGVGFKNQLPPGMKIDSLQEFILHFEQWKEQYGQRSI